MVMLFSWVEINFGPQWLSWLEGLPAAEIGNNENESVSQTHKKAGTTASISHDLRVLEQRRSKHQLQFFFIELLILCSDPHLANGC